MYIVTQLAAILYVQHKIQLQIITSTEKIARLLLKHLS